MAEPPGRELADRALEARPRLLLVAYPRWMLEGCGLDRALAALLDTLTVDVRAARETCLLGDGHACGHSEGACPVTRAADRRGARV